MKNRLLVAFISISVIFSGIPVSAADAGEALPAVEADTDASAEDPAITNDNGENGGSQDTDENGDDQNNAGSEDSGENGGDGQGDAGSEDSGENGGDGQDNADSDTDPGDGTGDNSDDAEDDAVSDREQTEEAEAPETEADDGMASETDKELTEVAVSGGRKIESVNVSATYTTATFSADISWADNPGWTDINLCYKRKGVAETWDYYQIATNKALYHFEAYLNRLSMDTEYEYVLILSDYYRKDPAEIEDDDVTQSGTFSTKKCDYALEFETKENAVSSREAAVSVTAKNVTDVDVVKLTLTLSDGQKQQTTLRKAQEFQKDITFSGLAGGIRYTVTDAVFTLREDVEEIEIQAPKQGNAAYFEFTTAAGEAPSSITLSDEKIGLNALYVDRESYEGINTKKLKAVTEPVVTAAELKWESSDANVATVTAAGEVRVRGVGTATITVSSVYDSAVKASCEVTAKKYVVGDREKYGSSNKIWPMKNYNDKITLYKGESVDRYLYCELDADNNCTALSGDCTVTFSNPAAASWNEGSLTGVSVGTTDVIFERDGVRTKIPLQVIAAGKSFAITEVKPVTADRRYAVKEGNGSYLLAYSADDAGINSYRASVRISPGGYSNGEDFEWTTSDQTVAQVDATGKITVKGAGTTELTIKPKKYHTINEVPYEQESDQVTLTVKALPPQRQAALYALANTADKLKDVSFPESWGKGWAWKYPKTPLVTNSVYREEFEFEAVYGGDEFYQDERTVSVRIGKITSIDVSEARGITPRHHVLEVRDGELSADWLRLKVTPGFQGYELPADEAHYMVEIPAVSGLVIQEVEFGVFDIKALRKGSYTIKPVIKAPGANGKVLARSAYPIKAVTDKQAASMRFKTGNTYLGTDQTGDFYIGFDVTENKTDFILNAEVRDRSGNPFNTTLAWKSADSKVAVVEPVSKTNTQAAKVTIKGSGHVAITAQVKDAAGVKAKINLEVRDHAPRIDKNKLTVNMAYDYSNTVGKRFAVDAGGALKVVPVYGETIEKIELRQKDSEQAAAHLTIEEYKWQQYLIRPSSGLSTGTYECDVYVETDGNSAEGETASYTYPLKVTVKDQAPKLRAQMGVIPNLFYNNMKGTILIQAPEYLNEIEDDTVTWRDNSQGSGNGFRLAETTDYPYDKKAKAYVLKIEQEAGLLVVNKKPADQDVTKGTLSLKLQGYQKPFTFENFAIRYQYKKPVLVTKNAGSNVILSAGRNQGRFTIYSKTDKCNLLYSTAASDNSPFCYDEITADRGNVALELEDNYYYQDGYVDYTYTGGETNKKIPVMLTLASRFWREDLTAVHTIKVIKPVACLKYKRLTFNTAARGAIYNEVYMKDMDIAKGNITYADMEIRGADPKSQKLLDDDRLVITQGGSKYVDFKNGNAIRVEQGQDLGKNPIAPGSYSFKITPYYKMTGTGERTALNTLTLKIRVIDKPVTAKVSPKGTIDLTRANGSFDKKDMVVLVDPKFGNLSDGYEITDYQLQGEYSQYFELERDEITYGGKDARHYYIQPKGQTNQKLKAGQTYRLSIVFTLRLNYSQGFDDSVTVTSNTFAIRPRQSAPAIKVRNNNQTLYAGAAGNQLGVVYYLSVPDGYSIDSLSGSIDCNKDGRADIEVSGFYYDSNRGMRYTAAKITDRHAVLAAANGKTYTIPVTVKCRGRDGVSRDAKISIKVKIKP